MAFQPSPLIWWRRILRDFAKWIIGADNDAGLRPGISSVELLAVEPVALKPATFVIPHYAPELTPAAEVFSANLESRHVVKDQAIRTLKVPEEMPPDADVQEQLYSVTEPYILWDSPKPPYDFPTAYFFDGVESLHSWEMPRPQRVAHQLRFTTTDTRKSEFRDLRKRRALFTLSPDLVRSRGTRPKVPS